MIKIETCDTVYPDFQNKYALVIKPTECFFVKPKTMMNKNKSNNSKHSDSENNKIGITSDNGQPVRNIAPDTFASDYLVKKMDQQFAKTEMEKLNQLYSVKLEKMKKRISEYQAAKALSDEAASQTEIGMLLNSPDVWGVIANRILS